MKKTTKSAAKADNNNRNNKPVVLDYTEADKAEMLDAARNYLREHKLAVTAENVRRVIADEHGESIAKQVCNGKPAAKSSKKVATKNGSKPARKTTTKPVRRMIFGFSVSSVARALGKAGMKPADAVAAIHKHQPEASVAAIRTFVQAGKHNLRGAPAALTKSQLKALVRTA